MEHQCTTGCYAPRAKLLSFVPVQTDLLVALYHGSDNGIVYDSIDVNISALLPGYSELVPAAVRAALHFDCIRGVRSKHISRDRYSYLQDRPKFSIIGKHGLTLEAECRLRSLVEHIIHTADSSTSWLIEAVEVSSAWCYENAVINAGSKRIHQ